MTTFAKYFDKVSVINLPTRSDRLKSITNELIGLGFSKEVIHVPAAPMPESDNGFPSRGVYGNYLSHLEILKDAQDTGARRVLVLEDDAIFSNAARSPSKQSDYVAQAEGYDWAMWFLGHKLRTELSGAAKGVIPSTIGFEWAHAYAVQRESLCELIDFLETAMSRPKGHPIGKMYIDGAYSHFRQTGSSKVCLVSNPALSIQMGSDSNLAGPREPGRRRLKEYPRYIARRVRDDFWRWTNFDFR